MQLPEEFMENPQFTFKGPQSEGCVPREPFDDLIEAMSEDSEDPEVEPRPQRSRTKTLLYQAEEEDKIEKEKRLTQSNEEKRKTA